MELTAAAQPAEKVCRIGFLVADSGRILEAFRQGLRALGYVEGDAGESCMTYELMIDQKPTYLHATVTGCNSRENVMRYVVRSSQSAVGDVIA